MVSTCGRYELELAEEKSVDAYLKNLGVGTVLRKVLTSAQPSLEILYSPDTDEWKITTETPFKTNICRFKLGKSVDDETLDARKCKTIGEVLSDEKLLLLQKCEEGPDVTVIKEKVGKDMLRVTWTANNVSATQTYVKVS